MRFQNASNPCICSFPANNVASVVKSVTEYGWVRLELFVRDSLSSMASTEVEMMRGEDTVVSLTIAGSQQSTQIDNSFLPKSPNTFQLSFAPYPTIASPSSFKDTFSGL